MYSSTSSTDSGPCTRLSPGAGHGAGLLMGLVGSSSDRPERLRGGDSGPDEGAVARGWPAGPAFRELSDMGAPRELHDFVGLSLDGLRLVKKEVGPFGHRCNARVAKLK
jgi:hypothetical protein